MIGSCGNINATLTVNVFLLTKHIPSPPTTDILFTRNKRTNESKFLINGIELPGDLWNASDKLYLSPNYKGLVVCSMRQFDPDTNLPTRPLDFQTAEFEYTRATRTRLFVT